MKMTYYGVFEILPITGNGEATECYLDKIEHFNTKEEAILFVRSINSKFYLTIIEIYE
jgi:hypothetical protein